MKKSLKMLLCVLCLALALCACSSEEENSDTTPTPAGQDVSDGKDTDASSKSDSDDNAVTDTPAPTETPAETFTLVEKGRIEMYDADTEVYEHTKTGARVMFILNEDTNRAFDIAFKTPIENDCGIAHVFEHACLSGSRKYPSRSLWFNCTSQLYLTYLNAQTTMNYTQYPHASLSEEQLLKLADYTVDSTFYPNVLTDENIFKTEAWRYSLDAVDADIRLDGTVYNEMKGYEGVAFDSLSNLYRTLYPGSYCNNNVGGSPDNIPNLTWDSVKAFHSKYYKPSNSLTVIYGKIENKQGFLDLLDGYFKEFDREEVAIKDEYTVIDSYQEATYSSPASEGSQTEGQSVILYGFACGDNNEEKSIVFDLFTTLMSDNSSILSEKMKEKLPKAGFSCYRDDNTPEISVVFEASGVNESDRDLFRETVDEALAEYLEKGFDNELLDAMVSSLERETLLATEGSDIGVNLSSNVISSWSVYDDVNFYNKSIENIFNIKEINSKGTFEEYVKKYLVDNTRRALVVTKPEPGLFEKKAADLAEKLAAIRASMSDEELSDLVAYSDEVFAASQDDSSEYLASLKAVDVASLPEEFRKYDIRDVLGDDGIRRIDVACGIENIGRAAMGVNISDFSEEDLQLLMVYLSIIGFVDSLDHTSAELTTLLSKYMYNPTVTFNLRDNGEGIEKYLFMAFTALDGDLQAAYDTMYEFVFRPDLSDADYIASRIKLIKNSLQMSINNDSSAVAIYSALSSCDDKYAAYNTFSGFPVYSFVSQLDEMMTEDPELVMSAFEELKEKIRCSTGMVLGFSGNEDSIALNRSIADAFAAKLDNNREISIYDISLSDSLRTGYVVDSTVNYDVIAAGFSDAYSGDYDARMSVVSSILQDMYLLPQIRDQYGAYGAASDITDRYVLMYSYDDPNITETYATYAGISEFFENLEIDQDTLEGYIVSEYSGYAMPEGELSGAASALSNYYYSGMTADDYLEYMRQLKSMKVEDVKRFAEPFINMLSEGSLVTAGSEDALNGAADLFDDIVNLFDASGSNPGFTDIPDDAWYQGAVVDCLTYGFVNPSSEDKFGADEDATFGQFAGAFYMVLGGPGNDGEAAVEALNSMGIATPAADEVMTNEAMVSYAYDLCVGLGIDMTSEAADMSQYPDASEISADVADKYSWMISNGIIYIGEDNMLNPKANVTKAGMTYVLHSLIFGN